MTFWTLSWPLSFSGFTNRLLKLLPDPPLSDKPHQTSFTIPLHFHRSHSLIWIIKVNRLEFSTWAVSISSVLHTALFILNTILNRMWNSTEIAEEVLYSVLNLDLPAVKPQTIHCNSVCLTSSLFFHTRSDHLYLSLQSSLSDLCLRKGADQIMTDFFKGLVLLEINICLKCPHRQAIHDVNEFVSSSEQIWRNLALHCMLTNGCPVNGCHQNESPNSW